MFTAPADSEALERRLPVVVALAALVMPRLARDRVLEDVGSSIGIADTYNGKHEGVGLHDLQCLKRWRGKVNVADSVCLAPVSLRPTEGAHTLHAGDPCVKVDIGPSQRDDFFRPHAGVERKREVDGHALVIHPRYLGQDSVPFLDAQWIGQLFHDRHVLNAVHRVVDDLRSPVLKIEDAA